MISERVKQVVNEEIASHQAAIIDLERFLDSDGDSKIGGAAVEGLKAKTAGKGKGPQLTDAQKAKQRKRVREYWKKKKAEKLAAAGASPEVVAEAEAADSQQGVPLLSAAK